MCLDSEDEWLFYFSKDGATTLPRGFEYPNYQPDTISRNCVLLKNTRRAATEHCYAGRIQRCRRVDSPSGQHG